VISAKSNARRCAPWEFQGATNVAAFLVDEDPHRCRFAIERLIEFDKFAGAASGFAQWLVPESSPP